MRTLKMKTALIAVAMALSCLCQTGSAQPLLNGESLEQIDKMRRFMAFQTLDTNAAKVAQLSGIAAASNAYAYFQAHAALAMLLPKGLAVSRAEKTNMTLAVVPILPEDIFLLMAVPTTRDIGSSVGLCAAVPNMQIIMIRCDYRLSWFAAGMATLHETQHAMRNVGRLGLPTHNEALDDELAIREVDRLICKGLGGAHYENAVSNRVEKLILGMSVHGYRIGEVFEEIPAYDAELDAAFGAPGCEMDRYDRRTMLNLEATFHLLEDEYKGAELARKKLDYIEMLENQGRREYLNASH